MYYFCNTIAGNVHELMEYSELKRIIRDHSLRITDCRMDVLEKFIHTPHALSFKNLEDDLAKYDRVTLYRTLNSFLDKGILHRIPDDSGFASYGTCFETCTPDHHHHNHLHFKCESCGNIECLPSRNVPPVDLPGYQVRDVNLVVSGVCQNCNPKN